MPHRAEIEQRGNPLHLRRGASNAITACLAVSPGERLTLICDEETSTVASSLLTAALAAGAECSVFVIERLAPRPMTRLPGVVVRALENSKVSIYAVKAQDGEWPHRKELIDLVKPLNLRHAHMINVTEDALCQGMLSDYRQIARLNELVINQVRAAREIRVTSAIGTDVVVTLDPAEPWENSAGIIQPGHWENLPNGEVLTCPQSVDGVFVVDGLLPATVVLDRFEMGRFPLRIEMRQGRVVSITGGPGDWAEKIQAEIAQKQNFDRIGLFGIGTNFDLLMPIGNPTQDVLVPGAYFSLGRAETASPSAWTSDGHRNFSSRKTSLLLDGRAIIENGRFDRQLLDLATRRHSLDSGPPGKVAF